MRLRIAWVVALAGLLASAHQPATAAAAPAEPFSRPPVPTLRPLQPTPRAPQPTPRPPQPTLRVGSLTLHRCESPAPWCGTLERPLDPAGRVAGTIAIYFEYYPHSSSGPAQGTLVATEGGPGYPATESRNGYLALFAPLRTTRDVVLMDNRGTGRSGAIDCVPLQTDPALTEENIARCGQTLGRTASLYSAAFAADDLAAILQALGAGPIDLYGDSYGTFFEQVFATRHPKALRSIVLDGAYPLDGRDYAWYPNYAPAMREKFNLACARSADCRKIPGTSMAHIQAALEALRRTPFAAQGFDADGRIRRFTANATQLAIVLFGSAPPYATVREADAAARAFVAGDRLPLLRLMAEAQLATDSRDESRSARLYSAGLAAAVMCQDSPQIFDMKLRPADRVRARDAAIAQRARTAPDTYAPFTIDEYRGMPLDYAFLDQCVRWPAAPPEHPATIVASQPGPYPDVPALVVSGDLDDITPAADGALAARSFPEGHQLIVPNGFHVNALPHSRSACPAAIVRHFIATLQIGDTSCLQGIPEVRLLPLFARELAAVQPARARPGNAAGPAQLRAVQAAIYTAGDVIARIETNTTGKGVGLRGGTFTVRERDAHQVLTLSQVRWTDDLAVSGTIDWPGRSGRAQANLSVSGAPELSGSLQATWNEGVAQSAARIGGRLGGLAVAAETGAP
ncbi:MAG TPA: alpha/beta fold hydrolase [Steroidobacteraceae bacterium]|nr:alpha/beta fold hydrolase [Steroidobacteraceae bacterium]